MAASSVIATDSSTLRSRGAHDKTQTQKNQDEQSNETTPTSAATTTTTRISPPETSLVEDHFFWTYSEEPHRSRRKAIIKAHPEVSPIQVLFF